MSYRAKWDPHSPECVDSTSALARLAPALEQRCVALALESFDALECRDYGRVDLRIDPAGNPWVIDINPNCDLHPELASPERPPRRASPGPTWPSTWSSCPKDVMDICPLAPQHRSPLAALLDRIETFTPDERACALELIRDAALRPSSPDYWVSNT